MQPLDPPQHAFRLVALAPRLSDRLDAHLASAVGVVAEGEGRRLACRRERDRDSERRQVTEIGALLRLTALRRHDRLLVERSQRPRRVPRASADPRYSVGNQVTRERADDGERSHDRQL